MAATHNKVTPPESVRASVRRLVDERGERGAEAVLGVSHITVARVLAGLPVTTATLALVEKQLGVARGAG